MTEKEILDKHLAELSEESRAAVERWLDRGDGVAVYEHSAIDSARAGHKKFVSFGSELALLHDTVPPERLPDVGLEINWAYRLVFSYRRAANGGA